ncbi:MAG: hypothetical protein Q8O29_14740 [Polaromonas sp.]|uniref:hypothetical protein n=1 Tax=Polaromonas sp. TaxID=1869339 RepID=UPI002735B4B4|nr:hypothetical protein [Polaromonas sp.]MDP2819493.1 hypothetical protein [Polaromonas sp.]
MEYVFRGQDQDNNVAGGFSKWSETGTPGPVSDFKSIGNVSDANFIGWGTWVAGQREYLGTVMLNHVHYIAGRPTSSTEIAALRSASASATYTLAGNTAPIKGGVAGTLTAASLTVNFSSVNYVVNASFTTSFAPGTPITETITVTTTSATFSGSDIRGALIGTKAGLAGLTYAKDLGSGLITGAAVFQK